MTLHRALLPTGPKDSDRTDELAEAAIEVAEPAGATVVLAHVFTRAEYEDALDRLEFDAERVEVSPDDVAARHATIRDIVSQFETAGVDYAVRGAIGEHGEAIVKLARDEDVDRVFVSGRRRSPTGKAVFGSTSQDVLFNSPAPVTYVRDERPA
jgi:nucleotide-binding universal stress UspA family protein